MRERLARTRAKKCAELGTRVYDLAKKPDRPKGGLPQILDDDQVKALLQDLESLDACFRTAGSKFLEPDPIESMTPRIPAMRTQSPRRSVFFRLLIPLRALASWPGIAATQDDFSGSPNGFDDAANRAEVAAALDSLANHARPCAFEWSSWAASRQQARLARVADCLVDAVVPWRQR